MKNVAVVNLSIVVAAYEMPVVVMPEPVTSTGARVGTEATGAAPGRQVGPGCRS